MGPSKKETPAGPAEAAPEEKEGEPELPPLPAWPGQETRKLQFLQLTGYYRFRWNMHHKVNLGLHGPDAPFYSPVSEDPSSTLSCSARSKKDVPGDGSRGLDSSCVGNTLGGADMRLRLEPTINVSEKVRVHTQLDLFDNVALGSTPRGLSGTTLSPDVPTTFFSDGQAPPVAGQNTNTPAILVKRVWAEVETPVGLLRVGRMPTAWGLGILQNDGSCANCDFGTTNDRIIFTTELSGHKLGMGYDFTSSGPNSLTVKEGSLYQLGQPIDLEKLDDVHQWVWMAGRMESEDVIRDKVDRGELVLNYGMQLILRRQDFDYSSGAAQTTAVTGAGGYASSLLERHAWTLCPDIWFKLMWKKLYVEFEGLFVGGKIQNISNSDQLAAANILQFGWALRSQYRFLHDSLRVGLDLGMASGDEDEPPSAQLNRMRMNPLTYEQGGSLREFRFNYDYQVDLILFREILKTVSNAFYFKPSVQYNVVDSFGARLDLIYSLAHEPVGFPGNARNLGLELDLDIFYVNSEDGLSAALLYGVLFPFGALGRPGDIYGSSRDASAEVAHTLQGRIMVRF
jgi:uncharacterized protein (TIGR04551 family)